jgi:Fe-S cluster biosynthesis and repair protein YggX
MNKACGIFLEKAVESTTSAFSRIILAFILLTCAISVQASFNKSLWPRWQVNNPLSHEEISHEEWQKFLDKHVLINEEGINLVDYVHLKPEDINALKGYINKLTLIDIDNYNRAEQLAFWINLYNALTVQTVASYYPVANIQEINISPGLFSVGPWGAHLVTIKNIALSLDDIDNRIIRAIWNDPRIHYTLNDATVGAPNLSKKVFQGKIIEQQLNDNAKIYINSLRGVQVIEGKLITSKIFDWYEEDYGGAKKYVIKHLVQFANAPLARQLKHINTIDSYMYNWHINSPATGSS